LYLRSLICSLRHGMMHMVVVFYGVSTAFAELVRVGLGWVGLDAAIWMAPLTREGTMGQNVYYEVILSEDGKPVHGPVRSGLV
jgi:hypothetical protein